MRYAIGEPVYAQDSGPNHESEDVDVIGYIDHVHDNSGNKLTVQVRDTKEVTGNTKVQGVHVVEVTALYNGERLTWFEVAT